MKDRDSFEEDQDYVKVGDIVVHYRDFVTLFPPTSSKFPEADPDLVYAHLRPLERGEVTAAAPGFLFNTLCLTFFREDGLTIGGIARMALEGDRALVSERKE